MGAWASFGRHKAWCGPAGFVVREEGMGTGMGSGGTGIGEALMQSARQALRQQGR